MGDQWENVGIADAARGHILGGAGTSATGGQIGASSSITNAVRDEEAIRQSSARDQPEHAGPTGADEPDGSHDDAASGDSSDGESQSEEQARGVWAEYHPDQGEQEGGADRQRSGFSHSVQQVQLRPHLQHPRQLDGTDPDLQVEDDAAAAASQEGCRGRQDCSQEMEEEPTMGVAHARALLASLWGHIGSARQLCFNPKVYHLGYPEEEQQVQKRQGSKGSN